MNILKNFIKKYTIYHSKKENDTVIFSTPRSGSTWLLEIIVNNSKGKSIGEPFDLRKNKVVNILKTEDWDFLLNKSNIDTIINYLHNISNGGLSFKNPPFYSKSYKPIVSHTVFKIIHGGENLMSEIINSLNAKSVFLIRHPIAVSLSRKQLPRLNSFVNHDSFNQSSKQKIFTNNIVKEGSKFEKAVLDWCFQNKLALKHDKLFDIKTTYEDLVLNSESIISEMKNKKIITNFKNIKSSLNEPSQNSFQSEENRLEMLKSKNRNKVDLVTNWQKKIDADMLYKAQTILDMFEIGLYSAYNPYPMYKF